MAQDVSRAIHNFGGWMIFRTLKGKRTVFRTVFQTVLMGNVFVVVVVWLRVISACHISHSVMCHVEETRNDTRISATIHAFSECISIVWPVFVSVCLSPFYANKIERNIILGGTVWQTNERLPFGVSDALPARRCRRLSFVVCRCRCCCCCFAPTKNMM